MFLVNSQKLHLTQQKKRTKLMILFSFVAETRLERATSGL